MIRQWTLAGWLMAGGAIGGVLGLIDSPAALAGDATAERASLRRFTTVAARVVAVLDEQAGKPAPASLTEGQRASYQTQSSLFTSSATTLKALRAESAALLAADNATVAEMEAMSAKHLDFYNLLETEMLNYASTSEAAKTRGEAVKASYQTLKG